MGKHVGVIVVDVQGDFTTYKDGSLAVPDSGKDYIEQVEQATRVLNAAGFPIFTTQDWHPKDHISFYTSHPGSQPFETVKLGDGRTQVVWPPHCVQETTGAEILIDRAIIHHVVQTAKDPEHESYSGFQDDRGRPTELDGLLRDAGVKTLVIYGIATDYCVKDTAIDAVKAGYRVIIVRDLCRGVAPETSGAAIEEMKASGVEFMETFDLDQIKQL